MQWVFGRKTYSFFNFKKLLIFQSGDDRLQNCRNESNMNILLMHLNPLGKTPQLGLSYIASSLEARGHKVSFLPIYQPDSKAVIKEISETGINLIFISVTSDSFDLCKKTVGFIKSASAAPILLGGIHPTICPDECIKLDGILGLCVGEGEYASCELADAVQNNTDFSKIRNLWVKKGGVVYKNEPRPLIQDLDALPMPNYEIFTRHINFEFLPVFLSRGCPFKCTYCCNHILQKLYEGKGGFLRYPSVPYSMAVVKRLLKQVPYAKEIEFFDDTFTLHKEWLGKFLSEFSGLGIKFTCNCRFDIIDEETIRLLARGGCSRINIAIECGNERIRKEVLKRNISDVMILEKSALIKRYNIRLFTHNMVGLPCEEEKDILKTIKLNKDIGADDIQASVFNPYPGTDLRQLCVAKGWIDKTLSPTSYFDFTVLRTPYIKPHIVNYYLLAFRSMIFDSGLRLNAKKALFWMLHFGNNGPYRGLRNLKRKILSIINRPGAPGGLL